MNIPLRRPPRPPGDADLRFLRRLLAAVAVGGLLLLAWSQQPHPHAPARAGVVGR